ncbi:MAG: GGDEF domain-containing protein [Ruminococcaceae bacterium]|nr:GGDEF domain-containing protein [Oscillospiraceae bacterium]
MIDFNDAATRAQIDKIVVDTIRKYSTDTVYFKDKDSKFIWNSLGHIQQLGVRSQEEALGKTDFDFFPKDFAQSARETELTIMQTGTPIINMVEELILDDENVRYYICSKYPLYDDDGNIIGTWGTSKDVTEQKKLENELQRSYSKMEMLTRVDDLSGLYNRRYFYEELEKYAGLYDERQDNTTFSIVVLDLDDMQYFNDQYGQQNGDLLLRYIADILLSNTRKADTCFRTGGDEFAVVLPDTDKLAAVGVAKKIISQISGNPYVMENKRVSISASAGVAAFNKADPDISDFLSRAERKLNKSKREGKNQVSF